MYGNLDAGYRYADLMELGGLTFINLVEDGMWKEKDKTTAQKHALVEDLVGQESTSHGDSTTQTTARRRKFRTPQ